jgi:hypothetical protein
VDVMSVNNLVVCVLQNLEWWITCDIDTDMDLG